MNQHINQHIEQMPTVPGIEGDDLVTYWYEHLTPKAWANYRGLSQRTVAKHRSEGGGVPFVRVSARCIRYRRIDGYRHDQQRLHNSTAEYETV